MFETIKQRNIIIKPKLNLIFLLQTPKYGNKIIYEVSQSHASINTIHHCLYGHYFLGIKVAKLAHIYKKSPSTIQNWIHRFEKDGFYSKKMKEKTFKKFGSEKREWLIELYKKNPILYQKEARRLFFFEFKQPISISQISVILHEGGLTYKVLERIAVQIKTLDIIRYTEELNAIGWFLESLLFIDEVSINNQSMLRKRGFGTRGERLVFRGEYTRMKRVSLVCFLGVNGIVNSSYTDGTFDRKTFVEACRSFAISPNTPVRQFPGPLSVWIMDNAAIHSDKDLVNYLRSLGVLPIFLPSYCPFYNPIEYVFGQFKRILAEVYQENCRKDIRIVVAEALNQLSCKSMVALFNRCGYSNGKFNPGTNYKQKISVFRT